MIGFDMFSGFVAGAMSGVFIEVPQAFNPVMAMPRMKYLEATA